MRLHRTKEIEPDIDFIRQGVLNHLAVCEAVRDGAFKVGFIGVDYIAGEAQTMVTIDNVDQTEALIRDIFGKRYPDLIGRGSGAV